MNDFNNNWWKQKLMYRGFEFCSSPCWKKLLIVAIRIWKESQSATSIKPKMSHWISITNWNQGFVRREQYYKQNLWRWSVEKLLSKQDSFSKMLIFHNETRWKQERHAQKWLPVLLFLLLLLMHVCSGVRESIVIVSSPLLANQGSWDSAAHWMIALAIVNLEHTS